VVARRQQHAVALAAANLSKSFDVGCLRLGLIGDSLRPAEEARESSHSLRSGLSRCCFCWSGERGGGDLGEVDRRGSSLDKSRKRVVGGGDTSARGGVAARRMGPRCCLLLLLLRNFLAVRFSSARVAPYAQTYALTWRR